MSVQVRSDMLKLEGRKLGQIKHTYASKTYTPDSNGKVGCWWI